MLLLLRLLLLLEFDRRRLALDLVLGLLTEVGNLGAAVGRGVGVGGYLAYGVAGVDILGSLWSRFYVVRFVG